MFIGTGLAIKKNRKGSKCEGKAAGGTMGLLPVSMESRKAHLSR
jgi:hypothetical protein